MSEQDQNKIDFNVFNELVNGLNNGLNSLERKETNQEMSQIYVFSEYIDQILVKQLFYLKYKDMLNFTDTIGPLGFKETMNKVVGKGLKKIKKINA